MAPLEQDIRFCRTADGVRMAYATVGDGPPLVKAANWLNHLEYDWASPIWRPTFEALASNHRFIRYDSRGNGLSDWDVEEISFEAFCGDLETIIDALGLERFDLAGRLARLRGVDRLRRPLPGAGESSRTSQVYAAEDTKLGRQVALKVLPPRMNSPEYRKRFEREAKAIAALNHPNIVHLYSVEHQNDVHFLTMELVKGKTLGELVQEKGLSLSQFLEVAANVTDGLASAHERGVIHRDLKPANVMVTEEGHAKILDFGVAKLKPGEFFQASNAPADSQTAEGLILGTIAYMSPEQAEGKELDHRTDLFSLGVILFEMATRIRPFQGESNAAIFAEILTKQPPNVSDINPRMPREVGRIVKRCLSKDRKRRYQTAFDIKNDLDELRLEVDSRSLFRPMRPDTHGRRMGIVATVVVAVVAAVVFGVYLHPGAPDRPGPVTGTFDR